MGCSAKRLSSTESGTVRSRFLVAGMARLSLPAPVPPLALLGWQQGIASLGHSRCENVLAADINVLSGDAAELAIELDRILTGKLLYAADSQHFKISQHGWTNRNKVL